MTYESFTADNAHYDSIFRPEPTTINGHRFKITSSLPSFKMKESDTIRHFVTEKIMLDASYI